VVKSIVCTLVNAFESYWQVLTVLLAGLIAVLSLWPLYSLPSMPGTDKTHHLIAYACLTLPVSIGRPRHWLKIVALIILFGGVIELLQPYVNRYGEWLDLLANITGVLIGLVLSTLIRNVTAK